MTFRRRTPITALDLDPTDLPDPSASSKGGVKWTDFMQSVRGLPNLYKKIATINGGTAARVRWLCLGDSYAQKLFAPASTVLYPMLGGDAGAFFSGSVNGTTINGTTGTVTAQTAAFDAWPSGLVDSFATGATRTYGRGGSTTMCDTIKVYYVKEPSAGTFKLQVDGADAAGFTNVSASGTLGQLGIATVSVARAAHNLTIVNLTGTVRIIGVGFEDSTVSGLVVINVAQGGIPMGGQSNSMTGQAAALANFQAFLADLTPDVMITENKENESYFAAALATLFATTAAGAPNMDVIGVGSPPLANLDSGQVLQNAQLKAACEAAGYIYWDSYLPFGSYAKMAALGLEGDGVHVSTTADQYRAMLMLRDLGVLDLYGRNPYQRQKLQSLEIGRALDTGTTPTAKIGTDSTFALDLNVDVVRSFVVRDKTGATVLLSIDTVTTANSFVPQKIRIGSSSNSCLNGDSASFMTVRRGDSTGNKAHFGARCFVSEITTLNNQSGTVSLDLAVAAVQVVNLTGNVTSLAFANSVTQGEDIEVHFVQDATGSRTLSGISGSIKLAGGSLTLTTTASKRDIIRFRSIGGSYYETSRSMNVG
jgi:hypothetical protein